MRRDALPDDPLDLATTPISRSALQAGISANPIAAATALDLLRNIDLEVPARGVVQESFAYGMLHGSAEHAAWLLRQTADRPMGPGQLRLSREGDTINILLDRPLARNAIDRSMRDALHEAFTVAVLDPEVSEVRLRGTGRSFSVGADLSEFGTTRDPGTAHSIRMQTLPATIIVACAHKLVAHVQGACIGSGLEMVAFADRLTASPDAWFQLPELAMGLIPGAGGCVSVTRRIGRQRAAAMILTGRRIGARMALDWGLIDAIVDDAAADHREANVIGRQARARIVPASVEQT